ncbi:MAG TPA: YceI family protein [Phototrophicaceae bacterium]|nr:YceI family protein [Phototrophicaceae bacterium]
MSQRVQLIIGALVLIGISSAASILIYTSVVGGSGEPSTAISAPTLALATATPNPLVTQVAQLQAEVEQLRAANATLIAGVSIASVPTMEATAETAALPMAEPTIEATAEVATSGPAIFRIVPEESEVRFTLTEELRGQPTTVIGKTDQVAGDIGLDLTTPANSQVGLIRINARTLATDNEFRNRAIRGQILQSSRDEYEFAEFTPTAITGLPEQIEVGEAVTFEITGDLKVRNIVKPATFAVTATLVSEDRLEGTAKAIVTRSDYDLIIPNAPGVANVSEEVTLEIDFVATRVEA